MYSALSTFNTTTEVPLSKTPNPQLLPGRRSINGCPLLRVCVHGVCVFTAVCVHFGWDKCRARIPSIGHSHTVSHTWLYVTTSSLFLTIVKLSLAILRKSQNLWDKRLQVPFLFFVPWQKWASIEICITNLKKKNNNSVLKILLNTTFSEKKVQSCQWRGILGYKS